MNKQEQLECVKENIKIWKGIIERGSNELIANSILLDKLNKNTDASDELLSGAKNIVDGYLKDIK